MGWQDRDYASEDGYRTGRGGQAHVPRMSLLSMTTKIIVANALIFFFLGPRAYQLLWMQPSAVWQGEFWRLFTATYLHANGTHILLNMLMLYFFGPLLEQRWGPRQFLLVYTIGGVLGNILLAIGGRLQFIGLNTVGVGASGSVWAVMAAAAYYYPHDEVYIYLFLRVKLRTFVIVYALGYVYNVFKQGNNYGGDICHLAGLGFGLWWAWAGQRALGGVPRVRGAPFGGSWKRWFGGGSRPAGPSLRERVAQRREDAATVDAILAKVYDKGIHNLTPAERKTLTEATARLKDEEKQGDRVGKA